MLHNLIRVLLITLCTAAHLAEPTRVQTLVPFDFINGQLIDLDTGIHIYRLADLKPNTGYEVRASFPASIPAAVTYRLIDRPTEPADPAAAAKSGSLLGRFGRRLLDTEKFTFRTDAHGAVQGIAEPHIELRAYRRSVHRDGPTSGAPKLVYNIVLAELVLGVARDTIPVVLTVVVVVLIALVWSLVWSNRLFPQLLDYLVEDSSSSGGSSSKAVTPTTSTGDTPASTGSTAAITRKAANRAPNKRSS